ncbi:MULTISPECIES: LLM class flavin-dependent oxidoreductase [Paenibacillus]|uniref:FMN-dependent oxidoreductase (Nitrilotriacetate monooxygenase family) n=1 Tax=Paenibacillus lactis TaxID=228574 RepID=A0ABS4F689_9BACL|nr:MULTISPECIES: LLM class flavin-dependent oxidoreductase [Paenibacillus]MBP1891587.1 FMN-dependent oxidoreductase (nitrilotriacetate monooxygenase family) [Paenibacillus lactis]MCM3494050.1 LLM class flavin-dependent oxidoreductase [Paenibacillus lactis]GIO88828.1 putative monooxygenase YxeK [Paenibacillus lactis]HAG00409.1 FMN-dependent monooxygenase [Paenibacillus lactis]
MSQQERRLSLGAFLMNYGHHIAAWRHPESSKVRPIDLAFYKDCALAAERGKFDMIFLADNNSIPLIGDLRTNVSFLQPEALTMLSALAGVTSHIGLTGTASTTFNEPYSLARRLSTLDHISGGRAAWNVVTSTKDAEARNFGSAALLEHGKRYERAEEFMRAVTGLWDSWEEDAVVVDREGIVFADTDKIHRVHHQGEYFRIEGPLNMPRSPQGRPVIIEAGTSAAGQRLAARTADVVFTACEDKAEAIRYYQRFKSLLTEYGREPDDVKVMPGLLVFLGESEEEARESRQMWSELILPEAAVKYLSQLLNTDLSGYPADGPLPDLPKEGNSSRAVMIIETAKRSGMSVQELGRHYAVARGHMTVTGSPDQIADMIEDWFRSGACDGFNVMAPLLPSGLERFVDSVVPLLQQRGIFRSEYSGRTLREHLGIRLR